MILKTEEDIKIFNDTINNPPEPNEKLKRAKKRYDRFNNRTISINGDIQIDVLEEEFLDKFTLWLEKNNWKFTGITKEIE